MGAAIHLAAGFMAVTDNSAAAVNAFRRHHMNGALEAIEIMRDAVLHDLDRLVVFVAAALALVRAGMKFVFWIGRKFRCENARPLFFLVSLDHRTSSRNAQTVLSGHALFERLGQNGEAYSGTLTAAEGELVDLLPASR